MKLDAKNDPAIRDFEKWVKDELHRTHTEQPSTAPPVSGAGSERWYVSKVKNDVSVSGLKVDTTEIYVEDGRADWCAQVLRPERAEQIVNTMNQHSTLIEQRDRLFTAAKFLLAMNATNYDRDAMRSEGGFDSLQKAVDFAIEQSRASASTIEQEGERQR